MSVNKELIQQWVDALRSGDYEQALEGVLKNADGQFCCLGVADDLFNPAEWVDDPDSTVGGLTKVHENEWGTACELSSYTADLLGLESTNPVIADEYDPEDGDPVVCQLEAIDANDEKELSFLAIADLIEEKYLK